jgi:hypothetical protein
LLSRVLEQLGIEPARFGRFYASAAEGQQLATEFSRMVEEIRPLGPLDWGRLPDVAPDDEPLGPDEAGAETQADLVALEAVGS